MENPVHVYNGPGNYTVTLIAANSIGSAVKTRTEYISVSDYINVEIPTIELIIGNSSQDLFLFSNETVSQTQTIPLAQSGQMVKIRITIRIVS